jgi:two-component system response regulator AtoC
VRELENVLERAVILARSDRLTLADLPPNLLAAPAERRGPGRDLSLRRARRALEARLITEALEATGGNRTHAARLLGISHRALLYKLKEYGLQGQGKD